MVSGDLCLGHVCLLFLSGRIERLHLYQFELDDIDTKFGLMFLDLNICRPLETGC